MKALSFVIWLRDKMGLIRHSKEGNLLDKPSNGELRRWLHKGAVRCNGKTLTTDDLVNWPITELVLFPKNDLQRVTII
jgi:hypothetical protein